MIAIPLFVTLSTVEQREGGQEKATGNWAFSTLFLCRQASKTLLTSTHTLSHLFVLLNLAGVCSHLKFGIIKISLFTKVFITSYEQIFLTVNNGIKLIE
jgi:hypothetical protein